MRLLPLLFLLSCDGAGATPKGDYAIDGLTVSDCASDSSTPTTFTATGGTGEIQIAHAGYSASCCLSFDVSAQENGGTIELIYTPVGDPCDCMCHYDLSYTVAGVVAGDWDVQAPDSSSASVTVQ